MGIYKNGKKIEGIYIGGKKVGGIYLGGKKIFSSSVPAGTVLWNDPHIFSGVQTLKFNSSNIPYTNGNKITLSKSLTKVKNGLTFNFSNFVVASSIYGDLNNASGSFQATNDPITVNPPKSVSISKQDLLADRTILLHAKDVNAYNDPSVSSTTSSSYDLIIQMTDDNLLYVFSSYSKNPKSSCICVGDSNSRQICIYPVFNSITAY